ncbi:hypothetical protein [Thioalkalivibrio sp.]|uniref:hypothetical protein n=1 Tax=Thioalkalivibrio sp. TaxID=2093813 RepID=UPI0012D6F504|nr:hypothetical protein [Thioalkalivibrio sp.]TVP79349.1 MAG: hypothetical protein EA346_10040 [Thioalkalivibrio sp.]
MMSKNILKALAFVAALSAVGSLQATEVTNPAKTGLDACLNGDVSASGRFPTQAMEDQYNAYVAWVEENNLDVTHAINPSIEATSALEPAGNGNISASGRFPTQAMEDQYNAYVAWVQNTGLTKAEAFDSLINN